jgi:pimeloyl-ACP methyl ester carboxylesterase
MAAFSHGGMSIAYDDTGPREGRPVVLIHGFASNRTENWRRLGWYGAFERRRIRCIALDCRGHGESAKPHEPDAYSRDAMAGDITALLDYLGVERADLMGYSMGARVALSTGLQNPARFPLLILGGIGSLLFEPPPSVRAMAEAMEADDPETIAIPVLKSFRHFADAQGEDRIALAACNRADDPPFERGELSRLTIPTLIVNGMNDGLVGDPRSVAAAIPGARLVRVPGCDHFSVIGHALFKAAVFDFFDGTLE